MSVREHLKPRMPASDGVDVPRRVATCPYCDAPLHAQATEWGQLRSGRWAVTGADISCTTEPDIDTDEWEDWWHTHSDMPYVHQLPVDEKVLRWLRGLR